LGFGGPRLGVGRELLGWAWAPCVLRTKARIAGWRGASADGLQVL
jgi:hypothetical protein